MTQPTPTKTRTPSMKWIKLGEGKDPQFMETVFLAGKDGTVDDFASGWLKKIEIEKGAKVYQFVIGTDPNGDDLIAKDFTHYCVPVPPII
jgi:hypothetical protein